MSGLGSNPGKTARPWWHYFLAGCLACLGLSLLAVVGGAAWFYSWAKESVLRDPARIEAMAAELLPGVKPLPDVHGLMGTHFYQQRCAVLGPMLGPLKPGQLGVIISAPSMSSMASVFAAHSATPKAEDYEPVSKEPTTLVVGGQPFAASRLTMSSGLKEIEVNFKREGATVTLTLVGSGEIDEELAKSFLAPIDSSKLR